jgi:hypothetical protein
MEAKENLKRNPAINIIISSLVWASVLIGVSAFSEGANKEITCILLSGYFIEFLRMNSANKLPSKFNKDQTS